MNENLEKLEKLTESLGSFEMIQKYDGFSEVKMEEGTSFIINLKHNDEIAVADTYLSNESRYPEHAHPEAEYIIVYEGELTMVFKDGNKILTKGDMIKIEPNIPHSTIANGRVRTISITIPSSNSFPI